MRSNGDRRHQEAVCRWAGLTVVTDLSEGFWHGASGEGDRTFYDSIVDFAMRVLIRFVQCWAGSIERPLANHG